MAAKAPEMLLGRSQLEALTGLTKNTILKMLNDPKVWAVKGGTKKIAGELKLPVSFYNRWLAEQELAPPVTKEAARA